MKLVLRTTYCILLCMLTGARVSTALPLPSSSSSSSSGGGGGGGLLSSYQHLEKRLSFGSLTEIGISAATLGISAGSGAAQGDKIKGAVHEAVHGPQPEKTEPEPEPEPSYPKDKNGHCPNCKPSVVDEVDPDAERAAMKAALGAETQRETDANTKAKQQLEANKKAFNDALVGLQRSQPQKYAKIKAYMDAHPDGGNPAEIAAILGGK